MSVSPLRLLVASLVLPFLGLFYSCREGNPTSSGGSVAILPSEFGNHGCNAPNQAFAPPVPVYSNLSIGPMSHIAAPAGADVLYLTAEDGIHELDFSGGVPPTDTLLVDSSVFEAALAAPGIGISPPAELSGVAVLDPFDLLVVELKSNSIWYVERAVPHGISIAAGFPSTAGGFKDGVASQALFNFTEPIGITPTFDRTVFVPDSGNNALRFVSLTGTAADSAGTIVGAGPGPTVSADGLLPLARLDTPVGTTVSCGGGLLIVETGGGIAGSGLRLREVTLGGQDPFSGDLQGDVLTLAGNGVDDTTQGVGIAASLATPRGLASSGEGEFYWVDSTTGILRRYVEMTAESDCPLFVDCATAVMMGGSFPGREGFSLAITQADPSMPGKLYVLDTGTETIYQVSL